MMIVVIVVVVAVVIYCYQEINTIKKMRAKIYQMKYDDDDEKKICCRASFASFFV